MITFSANPTPRERGRSRGKRSALNAFLRLLEHTIEFMEANGLPDGTAYVALGRDTPELYVVSESGAYDFALGDRVSEFAAPYIERGLLGGASLVTACSQEELAAYFDLNKVIRIQRVH